MTRNPLFGLVCTGGGAHGAYQVGALKFIHEKFSNGPQSPFQIFAGSSCGALNTTFFAAESFDAFKKRESLEDLWMSFHVPAYYGSVFKSFLKAFYTQWHARRNHLERSWSILDPAPMRKIVEGGFKRENLERSFKEKSTQGLAIAATELLSGRACWFQEGPSAKTWNLFHSQGIRDKLQAVHLAASCSVPIFLPPVKIHDHYYLDGSVSLSKPLSAAVIMGASRILTIATDRPFPNALPAYRSGFIPRFSNVVNLLLNRLSHDAAREEAIEIEAYHPIEVFLLIPSKRIRASAEMADENGQTGRRRTRFMFHEKFIREMIALGYEDAKSQMEDLRNFFLPKSRGIKRWFSSRRQEAA